MKKRISKMNEFKTCENNYEQVDWEEFKKKYKNATIDDRGYQLRIDYKGYTCFITYDTLDRYSMAWFRGEDSLGEDEISHDAKKLMGMFLSDCIFYFLRDGVEAPPLPAVFGEHKGRRGGARLSTQQQSELKQEHNPNHVISMLYELRDMCRSMHDGARTLR